MKVAANHHVKKSSSGNSVGVFHEEINGIRDVYRNNLSNFEATIMKLSEEIDQIL